MSLQNTPTSDRIHIGLFGKRNAGKSSIINAITGQNLAIVSDMKGTTTDPVVKSMELLPLGPVVIIDTPGLDDEGDLGHLRIQKAYQALNKTDIALLIVDANIGMTVEDDAILSRIMAKNIPHIIVMNKSDQAVSHPQTREDAIIWVSASTGAHIQELKELIALQVPNNISQYPIVKDLLHPSDFVILVVPIDQAAPKGRLILPQQQTLRDILDAKAVSIVVSVEELPFTLGNLRKKPRLVITDSQAFAAVANVVPHDIPLTSFSILFARHKGNLDTLIDGSLALDTLVDGDRVLISEGCTHHRQCGDIGTQKLPQWILKYTKKQITFDFTSGTEFPLDLSLYKLIIHCGGCMLNEREMKYRIQCANDCQIPITNYGTAIAHMKGILDRSISPIK